MAEFLAPIIIALAVPQVHNMGKVYCNHVFQKASSPLSKHACIPKSRLSQAMKVLRNARTYRILLNLRKKNTLVAPDNVGIKDESINHTLSDCEVQDTNEEHQQESSSSKENKECRVVVVRALDAVTRSNS